jgi:hypothetical protein
MDITYSPGLTMAIPIRNNIETEPSYSREIQAYKAKILDETVRKKMTIARIKTILMT